MGTALKEPKDEALSISRSTSEASKRIDLSVLVPVYNEEGNVPVLCQRLFGVLDRLAIASDGMLNLSGTTDKTLYGVLTSAGLVRWTGSGDLVLVGELELDPRCAVGLQRAVVDRHDQPRELVIAQLAQRRSASPPGVEALARHAEDRAEPGDAVLCLLRLDQPVLHRR